MTFPRIPLRRAARILNGGTPPSGVPEFWDGEVPFVTPPDLNGLDGAPLESTARTITADGVAHAGLAPAGSVLLSTRAPIGHIGRLTSPAAFNQGCRALVPAPNHEARFLAYALVAARADMDARGLGTTFLELSGSSLAQVDVPLAPLDEQRAIADYLDRETAQIDAFIAKNEELITLLTERRAAVIARAVTKGIDDAAELKPSGVPALGSIPTGWAVRRVRNVGRAIIGLTYAPEDICGEDDGGTLVLRAGNIQDSRLDLEDCVYVSKSIPDSLRLRLGDIVICARNGSARLIGKNALATEEVVGQTWGAFMAVLRTPTNEYLRWVLNSTIFTSSLGAFATATINQLTSSTLHSLQFALPPRDEQVAIAAYLEEATNSIDEAIRAAGRATDLARERRAALISAAVTGKIDVGVAV